MSTSSTSEPREVIHSHIERHPGIHFNELVRSVDYASGQVQHHVYRLLCADRVVQEPLYGRTHYYLPGYDAWGRSTLALLRQEASRDILVVLLSTPGERPDAVAQRVGIARSTLEYHLDKLVEQELVEKQYDGGRVTLHPIRPDETEALLEEITPTMSDQLVDRLMRLTDALLEGV